MGIQAPSITWIYLFCTTKQNPVSRLRWSKESQVRKDLNLSFLPDWILWERDERLLCKKAGIWFKLHQWGFALGLLIQEVEFPCRNNFHGTHICHSDKNAALFLWPNMGFLKVLSCQPVMFAHIPYKVRAPVLLLNMSDDRPIISAENVIYLLRVAYWLGTDVSTAKTFI